MPTENIQEGNNPLRHFTHHYVKITRFSLGGIYERVFRVTRRGLSWKICRSTKAQIAGSPPGAAPQGN